MTGHTQCCLPGNFIRDSRPRVCIASWSHTQAPSAWQVPKSQTPQSKAGVQHKPRCLHRQPRNHESFLSVLGLVRTLPKSKFPDASQGPTLQAGLSKDSSLRPATFTLSAQYVTIICHFLMDQKWSTFELKSKIRSIKENKVSCFAHWNPTE